jgi:hypothetical protein
MTLDMRSGNNSNKSEKIRKKHQSPAKPPRKAKIVSLKHHPKILSINKSKKPLTLLLHHLRSHNK